MLTRAELLSRKKMNFLALISIAIAFYCAHCSTNETPANDSSIITTGDLGANASDTETGNYSVTDQYATIASVIFVKWPYNNVRHYD